VRWAAYLLALQGLSDAFRDSCYLSEFVRFAEEAVFREMRLEKRHAAFSSICLRSSPTDKLTMNVADV